MIVHRAIVAGAALLGLLAVGPSAAAHTGSNGTTVVVTATPCAVSCAHWLGTPYEACANPFPPGSWADVLTIPTPPPPPGKVVVFEVSLDSEVDWDLFLCKDEPGTPGYDRGGPNILLEPCDNKLGPNNPVPVGCHEDASSVVAPGKRVIIRAYNFADPGPATITYWHSSV